MHSIFPPILEYTDNSDPTERGFTKYKRNKKYDNKKDLILIRNWLAFYPEPNIRVLYSILSLVFVFIFVCLSSMSLCLSCLYVFALSCLVYISLSCLVYMSLSESGSSLASSPESSIRLLGRSADTVLTFAFSPHRLPPTLI